MGRGYFPRKVHNHLTEQLEPIDASQLEGIIEVQQLGTGDGAKLYALADGAQVRNGQLNDLLFSLESGASAVGGTIVRPKGDAKMPPSSWHSFSRLNYSVPGVLLAPFLAKYNYRRVNSMLDYAGWNGTRRLTAISQVTVAANALLRAAADHVKLDAKFTSTLRVDEGFENTEESRRI